MCEYFLHRTVRNSVTTHRGCLEGTRSKTHQTPYSTPSHTAYRVTRGHRKPPSPPKSPQPPQISTAEIGERAGSYRQPSSATPGRQGPLSSQGVTQQPATACRGRLEPLGEGGGVPGTLVPRATIEMAVTLSLSWTVQPKWEATSPVTAVSRPMPRIETTKHG